MPSVQKDAPTGGGNLIHVNGGVHGGVGGGVNGGVNAPSVQKRYT